ncbi:MAG: hypothetical protein KBA51_05120 [Kiritimatiellae bacterium]|nr:hypothetical protein [Kiritimatiellia bacterium]
MPDPHIPDIPQDQDAQLAIEINEQLLETMPEDVPTLGELVRASALIGDLDRVERYAVRLARLHMQEERLTKALGLIPHLKSVADRSPDAQALLEELRSLAPDYSEPVEQSVPPAPQPSKTPAVPEHQILPSRQQMLQAELDFAWHIHDRQWVTREEYSEWVQGLTDATSSADPDATVSLLHVLGHIRYALLDPLMLRVATDVRIPYIDVSRFDTPLTVASMLSPKAVRRMGAAPFERMGKHVLIALLNPYNDRIRASITAQIGHRCHFYLTSAAEFDRWADKFAPKSSTLNE